MKKSVYTILLFGAVVLLVGSCKKDNNSQTLFVDVPFVNTVAISSIGTTTAISGGIVLSENGSAVTSRGICWSTTPNPTIAGNKTSDGAGLSGFKSKLTGLTAKTTYYIRAYATNAMGTSYGNEVSFATHDALYLNVATINIPAGTFTMGSPLTEYQRFSDEIQHQVTLSGFKMSKYEITNAQFATFLNAIGVNGSGCYAELAHPNQFLICESSGSYDFGLHFIAGQWVPATGCENRPVVNVTWHGAAEFATYVGGALPTEAQWEYACRAGTVTAFNTGDCLDYTQANFSWDYPYDYCTNSSTTKPSGTQDVGTYAPNAFGLFDMHGNVWEWCSDWFGTYPSIPQTNPMGPIDGSLRVYRGSSWTNAALYCRSANRGYGSSSDDYADDIGFRIVFPQ